jgi:hypothetical protein
MGRSFIGSFFHQSAVSPLYTHARRTNALLLQQVEGLHRFAVTSGDFVVPESSSYPVDDLDNQQHHYAG